VYLDTGGGVTSLASLPFALRALKIIYVYFFKQ